VQAVNPPPSIWQANVPASVDVNEKLAFALVLGFVGLAEIVVFGATVSTVKVVVPDPTLLAASVALTTMVCEPSARPV
jgi:hypothetical protein